MSTDSDLDEDELLQMALKEQAERDLNYQKPPSKSSAAAKPVANYVQPPSTAAGKSPAMRNPNPRQRHTKSIDEDDDSEVELLSISSGDEESSKASTYGGGGGGKGRRARAVSKDDADGGWDGGEPACWKHVNEAELARRVREMREARAIPVVAKEELKPAGLGKKGLTTLQSFPRGMECIDPLGLGIIDNRTLRLITDTLDSSPSKEKENIDNNLREKLAYFSERFDAKLFLSRIHQDTSAADLEAGALAIKTDLKGRTQQRKDLVKENFDCFVSCKTTIDDIESKLKRIEEDPEGAGTMHLYNIIQGVSSQATRAFEPLFERQAQAEKIRSVQGMLQRFRTLFNLPSTIRSSISNGEYDLAVREYKKAKSIALPSHVGILKRVLEEVEKVMHEFKGTLCKTMEDPQIDLTSLENTVRLLLELEPESDPVWHYLNLQNQRIRTLLENCTLDYEAALETLQNAIQDRAASDAKWNQILDGTSHPADANGDLHLGGDYQSVEMSTEEIDALKRKYIHKLSAVLIHYIPAFWKIALSVFSGKFAKSSQVAADSNVSASNKTEEKGSDVKYSSHSLDEVSGMMRSTISLYEVKVLNTFREFEESNILRTYMSDAIKEISKACRVLEAKESAPAIIVMALRAVHAEVSKTYILRLCSWMRSTIEELSRDETWVTVSIIERNKSPYRISYLPLAFRAIVISAIDQVHQMLQALKSDAAKAEDVFIPFQEIQESVRLSFLNCFLDFAGHLERIGSELSQSRSNRDSPHLLNGHSYENSELSSDLSPGSVIDPHQQLLMVLSNVGYCKDELCYELYNKYKHIWSHAREKDEEDCDKVDLVMAFSALEEKVLEQYTLAKANLIRTAAMNYLLDAGVLWGAAPSVKGVRDAAVELLHTLVAVHAEVFAGAKPLLDKTLGILVEGLIDTLLSIFHENESKELKSLDVNGFCQLMLEVFYFLDWVKYLLSDSKLFQTFLRITVTSAVTVGVVALGVGSASGYISSWTGRFYSLLDPTYAKDHIPIIASVSEHQPTAWSSFMFDFHILLFLFPAGLYFCFKRLSDATIFIVMYGLTSMYFAGVMVRLILVATPAVCLISAIAVSATIKNLTSLLRSKTKAVFSGSGKGSASGKASSKGIIVSEKDMGHYSLPYQRNAAIMLLLGAFYMLSRYVIHCTWVTSEAYSSPSIVLAARGAHGNRVIFDDYREAYYWLRQNTPADAKIMSWWDYGYQITAMGNRTVIVDNNTWNNTHIATVGRAMSSYEDEAYEIMQSLDVDYVLVVFGGVTGYSSDDINKFLWMVRIGGGVFPVIKEPDYLVNGEYRVDKGAAPKMLNCLMYKLCYYRFGELRTEYGKPPGFDRARGVEIGNKDVTLEYLEEAFTTSNWIVRIYKVKPPKNRS